MNLNNTSIPGLVYLASPYSRYPKGREAAFQEAARLTGLMLEYDFLAFSPIVYSHPLALFLRTRTNDEEHDFWMHIDRQIFRRCDALVVAMMDGWHSSKGVAEEVAFFRWAKKPVWFLDPEKLELELETLA